MGTVDVVSLNARGLGDYKKRRELFHYLHVKKYEIIMLQETHSETKSESFWRAQWGQSLWLSHGTNNSAGVAILISNRCQSEIHYVKIDVNGRYIIMDITIGEQRVTLVNIYGPNRDDTDFFNNLMDQIEELPNDHRIIGGDFNVILDLEQDRKGGSKTTHLKSQEILHQWFEDKDLVDIWRAQHPCTAQYTWFRKKPTPVYSRLDYFIVSFGLSGYIEKTDIIAGYKTDHSMIRMKFRITSNKRGPGYWKLNCSLLAEEQYVEKIRKIIQETQENNPNTDPPLLWDTVKCRVRGETIAYASKNKREHGEKIKKLEKKLQMLQENLLSNQYEIEDVKTELTAEIEKKTQYAIFRTRMKYYDEGEKASKYFLNLQKRNFNKKVVNKLSINGSLVTNPSEILKEQVKFYEQLYTSNLGKETEDIVVKESFFNESERVAKLTEIDRKSCEGLITAAELRECLKTFSRNKTPGMDGFPFEFYLTFWDVIESLLINCFNFSYESGEMSITQRQGVITLIPKKDRNVELLKNWRPLAMLNFDYKLLTKCLALRLKTVLHKIIHKDQTGFLKERYIGENINKVLNISSIIKESNLNAYLMTVDFEKAFDYLEFSHIKNALNYYNFGPMMIQWIQVIYNNISSCVVNNGWISTFFNITRGVRQGCPLSPYLFIISLEILANHIRKKEEIEGITINNIEYKLALYADDITLFLTGGEPSVRATLDAFAMFLRISGLRVNIEKTNIMPLGGHSADMENIKHLGVSWTDGPLNILGIRIENTCNNSLFELNYAPKLDIVKQQIAKWLRRDMTPMGRIVVLKSHMISQFVYLLSNIPTPPKHFFIEFERLIFDFIWSGKKAKIKKSILYASKNEGGLDVPHLLSQDKAAKISWLHRIVRRPHDDAVVNLVDYLFKGKLKFILTCNFSKNDCNVFENLPCFWIDVIQAWADFNFHNPMDIKQIISQSLWYNSHIKIENTPVFYKYWYEKNINYIYDIIKQDKDSFRFLSLEEINIKYQCNIKILSYNALLDSIPKDWRMYIKLSEEKNIDSLLVSSKYVKICKMTKITNYVTNNLKSKFTEEPRIIVQKWNMDGFNVDLDMLYHSFNMIYKDLISVKLRMFQYKLLHRKLALNPWLCKIGLKAESKCTICRESEETIVHFFCECEYATKLWNDIKQNIFRK